MSDVAVPREQVVRPRAAAAIGGATLTFILSSLLTLALAVPVLVSGATQIFGVELVGRHHDPFTVIEQYEAGYVPRPYLQPATDGPGFIIARLTDGLTAYNTLVIVSFPLAALGAYAHARYLIGGGIGAVAAALLFAMAPFHLAHAAYHVHLAQVQWLPLFFLALWRLLDRPTLGRAAWCAAALVLAGAASFYFGFIAAVSAPIAVVAYVWIARGAAAPLRSAAWAAATIGVAALITIAAVWVWRPEILSNPAAFAFPEMALDQHTARWWSYLLPPAAHPVVGATSSALWHNAGVNEGLLEQQVSLGAGVLALAAIPLVIDGGLRSGRRAPLALAFVALVAAICSLPPTLTLGTLTLPMPSALLHDTAPMFRAFARFGVVVTLMVTTMAGAGVAVLLARRSRAATMLACALLGAAAFEYLPRWPVARDVLPTSGHRWLAGRDHVRVFDCVRPSPGQTAGVAAFMGAEVGIAADPIHNCADPELAAKLAAFGYTHLLVRGDSDIARWLDGGGAIPGVAQQYAAADARVFAVGVEAPLLYTTSTSGVYPRELSGALAWQWFGPRAEFAVLNATTHPIQCTLRIDLEAFAVTRRLQVAVDAMPLATLVVEPRRSTAIVGPATLGPGSHLVAFDADGSTVPAHRDPASADARALAVRVFDWRWECRPVP